MVSARRPYSDNWEQFFNKIHAYSPKQRTTLLEEAQIDPKLAMIHELAREWVNQRSREDWIRRLQGRQARILEERRMTPDPAAFRDYLDPAVRAMLPPISVKRRYGKEREMSREAASRFWAGLARGSFRNRTVARIVARCSEYSPAAWNLAHPYGPPTSQAAIDEHLRTLRSMQPAKTARPIGGFDPAGMTPEKALQIAMRVFEGNGA